MIFTPYGKYIGEIIKPKTRITITGGYISFGGQTIPLVTGEIILSKNETLSVDFSSRPNCNCAFIESPLASIYDLQKSMNALTKAANEFSIAVYLQSPAFQAHVDQVVAEAHRIANWEV